jgi:hypothetical protein
LVRERGRFGFAEPHQSPMMFVSQGALRDPGLCCVTPFGGKELLMRAEPDRGNEKSQCESSPNCFGVSIEATVESVRLIGEVRRGTFEME